MKKYALTVLLALLFPTISYAVWWNPATWVSSSVTNKENSKDTQEELLDRISDLEKKINRVATSTSSNITNATARIDDLVKENANLKSKLKQAENNYASCQAGLVSVPVSTNTILPKENLAVPTQLDTPYEYSKYSVTDIPYYIKNPKNFLGWGTHVTRAKIFDFLASGDRGVSNNYIEISDIDTGEKMMILVESDSDYTKAVAKLQTGDRITVYGVGSFSQKFQTTSSFSSSYEPVVAAQRLDKCNFSIIEGDPCQDKIALELFRK